MCAVWCAYLFRKFIISLACVVSCDQLSVRFFLIFPVRLVFDFLENIELA